MMNTNRALHRLLAGLFLLLAFCHHVHAQGIVNGGFEAAATDPWRVTTPKTTLTRSPDEAKEGAAGATLLADGKGTGIMLQTLDAAAYRGKLIRFEGWLRCISPFAKAQLWLRVDRDGGNPGFFDNMFDRPVVGATWKHVEITGNVEPDATSIVLGAMVQGPGPIAIDGLQLTVLGDAVNANVPPAALAPQVGLRNLVALTRLVGIVRHFSASDQSAAADWDAVTIAAIEHVELAGTSEQLAAALTDVFAPLAPGIRIAASADGPQPAPTPDGATHWTAWVHHGFGQTRGNDSQNIYRSRRITAPLSATKFETTSPGETVTLELSPGVRATILLGAYSDGTKTLPLDAPAPVKLNRPVGWRNSTDDRTTRLAAVMLAWSALKHFYPYFDVVHTDWDAALAPALEAAATDKDSTAFHQTLSKLGAALKDGHTWIGGDQTPTFVIPVAWEWVDTQLVVTSAALAPGLLRGDVVTEFDGTPIATLYDTLRPRISSATEQWARWRALSELRTRLTQEPVVLSISRGEGAVLSVRVTPVPPNTRLPEGLDHPETGAEVAPGIRYFDLNNQDERTLKKHLKALSEAKAVVFDLRGYPGDAGIRLLPHLREGRVQSAFWNVPVITRPGLDRVTFDESRWDLPSELPQIKGKRYFLTDGRAISYAESCMGVIEAYKLGEIVGSTTAGTNGNIVTIPLPGKTSITFTGMRVLKHDRSTHHGVGIAPTIPCTPTVEGIRAGRDEVLERAVAEATK